jgi:predicted ribosome quality control (RQC) complex YloA/Tae2 family protein|tara:strand:- start:104 stop:304 length:201 start_codon:yes stop_codon:yes gene_type:complete
MIIDEKKLQEELAILKADFDKTKKQIETIETEANKMRNNLNAVYGAMQQTEKLLKLSRGEDDGKKV